jgi:GNAT superfamily N-acetyltransferase
MHIRIREARPPDLESVVALVPRLRAFGSVSLRTDAELDRAEHAALTRAIEALPIDAALFVVECPELTSPVVGVAYVETATDYFTHEKHAHLAILAVAREVEGQGAGRALLERVEQWAAQKGYRLVTLNVFAANERARSVYERAGYAPDTLRYAKEIR